MPLFQTPDEAESLGSSTTTFYIRASTEDVHFKTVFERIEPTGHVVTFSSNHGGSAEVRAGSNFETGEAILTGANVEHGQALWWRDMPNEGYYLSRVYRNSTPMFSVRDFIEFGDVTNITVSRVRTIPFLQILEDTHLDFVFKPNPVLTHTNTQGGSVHVRTGAMMGAISSGDIVDHGTQIVFFPVPDEGYRHVQTFVNDVPLFPTTDDIRVNTHGFYFWADAENINMHTIFEPIAQTDHLVTYSHTAGGSIEVRIGGNNFEAGEPISSGTRVADGQQVHWKNTALEGYRFAGLYINDNLIIPDPWGDREERLSFGVGSGGDSGGGSINIPGIEPLFADRDIHLHAVFVPTPTVTFSSTQGGSKNVWLGSEQLVSGQRVGIGGRIVVQINADERYRHVQSYINGMPLFQSPDDAISSPNFFWIDYTLMDVHIETIFERYADDGPCRDALRDAIEEAERRIETNYTAISWRRLENSLSSAIAIYNNINATQAQIDTATANLLGALNALVLQPVVVPIDRTALQLAIDDAGDRIQANYTALSWRRVETALNAAINMHNNANATQAQINTATTNLNNALAALVSN